MGNPVATRRPPATGVGLGPTATEAVFAAMGTQVHLVVVDGPPDALDGARRLVDHLEARWSRFRPESDLSRLGRADGAWVSVHPDTVQLLEHARAGWEATAGRFDPTVLPALVAAGYDTTFATVVARPPARADAPPGSRRTGAGDAPAPGLASLEVDRPGGRVRVPAGVGIDPGAIGKGLAADLVVERVVADGAAGAMANVGGDLRAAGAGPGGDGWGIEVVVPGHDTTLLLAVADGAVATSTPAYRRWHHDGRPVHHLVDPRTGRPADRPATSATVVAGTGWLAEVLATSLVLGGPPEDLLAVGATGLVVDHDGGLAELPGLREYRR